MNFDELDSKMRTYEQSLDQVLLPELYMVARLDGNRFTRLTKEVCQFEAPFDTKFRDLMVDTVKALMNYGFRVVYGFTESDDNSIFSFATVPQERALTARRSFSDVLFMDIPWDTQINIWGGIKSLFTTQVKITF